MLTPAIRAPISRDRPSWSAKPAMPKHHATEEISTSSGRLAEISSSGARMNRLARKATPTSTPPPAMDWAMRTTPGSARLGCTAMKRMAQMSCTTSTPRVSRPERILSSNFSRSSLTTIRVELSEITIAR